MTILTIKIPDKEASEILKCIEGKGGKIVSKLSTAKIKHAEKASFKQGFKEAILISRGEMQGIPLSELWDD